MSDPGSPPVSGAAPDPTAKKGLSPLAWIGIGCGGLVLLGIIAMTVLGVSLFNWGRGALQDASGEQSFRTSSRASKTTPSGPSPRRRFE